MSKDVSPSVKTVEEEEPMCSICCGELTVKNIVNPECGHATCKDCFWRWAKDKNSCPFCRTNLLKNTEEAQEIQQMRNLLEHRTRIVRQVESAYDEEDRIKADVRRLKRNVSVIRSQVLKFEQLKKEEHKKLMEIKKANGGTYQTFKYFKEKILESTCKDRLKREKIDEASMNLAHGDKGMCMEVLRDIKILRRAAGGPWEYGWFCKPKLDKVREMNRVRKERRKFREKSGDKVQGPSLRALFEERIQRVTVSSRGFIRSFDDSYWENISTVDDESMNALISSFMNNITRRGLFDNSDNVIIQGSPDRHAMMADDSYGSYTSGNSIFQLNASGSDSEPGDMPELEPVSGSDSDSSIDSNDDMPELE